MNERPDIEEIQEQISNLRIIAGILEEQLARLTYVRWILPEPDKEEIGKDPIM